MIKLCVVIDVVMFEVLVDEFLEEISFFIGVFGRIEVCDVFWIFIV